MLNKNMSGLLKQAQKMQEEMARVQENLINIMVEGTAGGNMVKVTANAAQDIVQVKINPEVVDPQDVEMLEDMVLAATKQALANARAAAEKEMSQITGGFSPDMLGGLKLPGF
jgi:nucleoid-associated protein EbfC